MKGLRLKVPYLNTGEGASLNYESNSHRNMLNCKEVFQFQQINRSKMKLVEGLRILRVAKCR